jgi:hypothetical protein
MMQLQEIAYNYFALALEYWILGLGLVKKRRY